MRILVMGGTRFIGVSLTRLLVEQGHEVVLFNRGNKPVPVAGVAQIQGDRSDPAQLKAGLAGETFDAVFDNTGRERRDTESLLEWVGAGLQQLIYVSSAGVYLNADQLPLMEGDPLDPNSRHRGKFETEQYLQDQGIPFTAVRPVYIYGPQNYNPIEGWFFDRIVRDRPIPIPGNGLHITQLGHVADLAAAMVAMLGNPKAIGQIYNIAGDRFITFDGLARACAIAANRDPDQLELVHYNPKSFDFGKQKAFPLRMQHFFASITKAQTELNWQPKYDLIKGLRDSFNQDYSLSNAPEPDFALDNQILQS
ncbi:MAG: NAD-dependent epimerase/dehydratase family protein [Synechococcales cyanobacterium RM1_1_8]|nr:NAD-dependent epimerase/dehydratase family protein [Synechococcales cyanobacterium RM1_1_8]